MNFSVIDRDDHRPPNLDFSAHSLLADPATPPPLPRPPTPPSLAKRKDRSKASGCQPTPAKPEASECLAEGGFLRDLSRMEKELSF
jgi:hypothetical protein